MRAAIIAFLLLLSGCGQPLSEVGGGEPPTRNAAVATQRDGDALSEGTKHISDVAAVEDAVRLRDSQKTIVLSLDGVTQLSPEAAKLLMEYSSCLVKLNSLVELSAEAARHLSRHESELQLNGLASLRVATAERLVASNESNCIYFGRPPRSLCLDGLRSLESDLAEALAGYDGTRLSLNGLTELEPQMLMALGKFDGCLTLGGIRSFSLEDARALLAPPNSRVGFLELDGVASLRPEVEEFLAELPGKGIRLNGLTQLTSVALATKLASSHTRFAQHALVQLNGLTHITPEVAQALARSTAAILELNGLRDLSPEVAAALGEYRGNSWFFETGEYWVRNASLRLDGVDSLDAEAAAALVANWREPLESAQNRGLNLNGLGSLSPEAARALAAFQGDLRLDGLKELSPETVVELAKYNGILKLPAIAELSPAVAAAYAQKGGKITFSGLKSLSPDVAEKLATSRGVSLGGLTAITPDLAKILSRCQGDITLPDLKTISVATAEAFASHTGALSLDGLEAISEAEADALSRHPGRVSVSSLRSLASVPLAKKLASSGSVNLALATTLSVGVVEALADAEWYVALNATACEAPLVAAGLASLKADQVVIHGDLTLNDAAFARRLFRGGCQYRLVGLGPSAAAAVADLGNDLDLSGLERLSVETATALATHEGRLFLAADHVRDDIVAEAIATHAGPIEVYGLTHLTNAALAAKLAKSADDLSFLGLEELSPAAASALATHEGTITVDAAIVEDSDTASSLAKHSGPIEVIGLTRLTNADLAAKLAQSADDLEFEELSPAAAAALAKHEGELLVPVAIIEDSAVANALAKHVGPVLLAGSPKRLGSAALAKKLVEDQEDGVDLSELVELTPAVAAVLASGKGWLDLPALAKLDEAVAAELSKHEGALSLGAVTAVDAATAVALARHQGSLTMPSLTTLDSPELAVRLVAEPPEGVERISVAVAEALSSLGEDQEVSLPGLKLLPVDVAAALGQHKGSLQLDGLESLDADVAEALVREQRWGLSLDGLRELSEPAAAQLAKQEGDVSLDGLTAISEPVAEILAAGKCSDLSLNGLKEISPTVAATLATKRAGNLSLNGLVKVMPEVIAAFHGFEGALELNGISKLEPNIAGMLAGLQCRLECGGLTELTSVPLTKKLLGSSYGVLDLKKVKSLSSDVATQLAGWNGTVWLDGLTETSEEVRAILCNNPRMRFPMSSPQ